MGKGLDKTILILLALLVFLSILPIAVRAQTLQPRLLWEKTIPFKIDGIKMAAISGDVIMYSRDARQIILYDKQGNKRFHWGPRIDRQPMGIDISTDGNTIVYTTNWTVDYRESKKIDINKLGWDTRVHYSTNKGKELWNKKIEGSAFLSPNSSLVAVVGEHGMGGVPLTVLDSRGNILWKYDTGLLLDLHFSPDGNYVLFYDGKLQLFDKSGNLLWVKDDVGGSITGGAAYIVTNKKVYDKQGNIVMEILEGDIRISDNGNRAVFVYPNKVSLLSWPDKVVLKEYSFTTAGGIGLSHDGRFLVVSGTLPMSSNNLFIYDTVLNTSWETKIEQNFYFLLSDDGKYLLVVMMKPNKLRCYQVY